MWTGVTLDEPADADLAERLVLAKAHLRVLHDDEDDLIAGYLAAAVSHVEGVTGTRFYPAAAVLTATAWADLARLPVCPLGEVVTITYFPRGEADPVTLTPPPRAVRVDPLAPYLLPGLNAVWPSADPDRPITITTTAGYDGPPSAVWQAILLLVGQWYRNRTPLGEGGDELPHGVNALLANHKRHLL